MTDQMIESAKRITDAERQREAVLARAKMHVDVNTMGEKPPRQSGGDALPTNLDVTMGRAAVKKGIGQELTQ